MKRALVGRQDESTYDRRPHLVASLEDQCLEYTPRTVAKQKNELQALRERVLALENLLASRDDDIDSIYKNPVGSTQLPPLARSPTKGLVQNASLTKLPTVKLGFELERTATAPASLALPVQAVEPPDVSTSEEIPPTTSEPPPAHVIPTKFIADQDGSLIVAVSKRSNLYRILQQISNRVALTDDQIFRLKKMVDAEFGDVISVLEAVEHEEDVNVVQAKMADLIQTGSPSKFAIQLSPPKFKMADVPYPLTKIAQNLATMTTHQEVVVLVASGAYNPVHMLHIRAFYVARQHIEANYKFAVVGGIISPCHDTYVRTKNRRKPREMIPKAHRLAMLEAATASSSWIEVDKWEITRRRVLDYLSTLTHVREICEAQFPQFKFRVLYVCGVNTVVKLSHTALRDEGFGCIAVCRPNQTEMLYKHLGAK
ncbi:unnamed protein product [Aphanomyces euteiches]